MVIRLIEEGLYWERVRAVFLIATLHLGTLGMTSVFFSTISLSTKKTMVAAVIMMFLMFFIGGSHSFLRPGIGDPVQYASTWFYYNPAQFFGAGNFGNFLRDVLVLGGSIPGRLLRVSLSFESGTFPFKMRANAYLFVI